MWWRRQRLVALALGVLLAVVFAASEVRTPAEVAWEAATLQGIAAERAPGLVLQYETDRDVWASEGYSIYRSRDGGAFERVFTLRPRLGEAWAGYARTLRRWFGYQELVELLPLDEGHLVVFGGGDVYRVDLASARQERVHTLRYFGRGKGRGVMPHGLTLDPDGNVYYGEYPTHPDGAPGTIRVWRATEGATHWEVAFEFGPGEVRHIHGVQWDPYGEAIWIGTGDRDSGSRIGFSRDRASHFEWVGTGSQLYRACSLLFFPEDVVWATDADLEPARVGRWSRGAASVEALEEEVPAPTFYAQALDDRNGVIGLAERDASLWRLGRDGRLVRLFRWTMPVPARPGPHPSVRLARVPPARPTARPFVLVNPLRTVEDEATIWRLPRRFVVDDDVAARQ